MNKKSFISLLLLGGLIGCGLAATQLKPAGAKQAKADSYTVTSDFVADISDNQVAGLADATHKYMTSDESTSSKTYSPLATSELFLFDGDRNKDSHIGLYYKAGNTANYYGGIISSSGYFYLRYASVKNTDGSSILIESKDPAHYLLTSVTIVSHQSHATNNSKTTDRVVIKDISDSFVVDSTSPFATFFNSGTPATYTYNTGMFKSLQIFNNKGDSYDALYISSISVTYEEVSYNTVTFDTDGGSNVANQYISTGGKVTRPADPTKESVGTTSYTFDDWYTTAQGSTKFDFENTTISSDTTIYAHWNESFVSTYTITFEENGGTEVADLIVDAGTPATKPANPTRATSNSTKYAYSFGGWYTDSDLKSAYDWSSNVTDDITLYAKWSFSIRDITPSGRVHYRFNNNIGTWAPESTYVNDQFYSPVDLDSRETFDTAGSYPQVFMNFTANASNRGFSVHKHANVVVHSANITVTFGDYTSVATYAQFNFGCWGNQSTKFKLYKNSISDANLVDTETEPVTGGESSHCVAATFAASDRVTKLIIVTGSSRMSVSDFFLKFDTNPDDAAAISYATDFNDSQVCGATDSSGLDTTKWGEQADAFDALDGSVKSYIASYDGENAEIVEMLERYDRVIYLHGVDYDFMGRVEAMNIPYLTIRNGTILFGNNESIFEISIAVISAIALTTLLVIQKKKQK